MNLSFAGIGVSALALVGIVFAGVQASKLRTDLQALDDRVKTLETSHAPAGAAPKAADLDDADKFRQEMARFRSLLDSMKERQESMGGNANPSGLTMLDLRKALDAALADKEREARAVKAEGMVVRAGQHNEKALEKAVKDWRLTPEQKEKIRAILNEQTDAYKQVWLEANPPPEKAQEVNAATEKKILEVLTEEQKGPFRVKPIDFFQSMNARNGMK